jgi:hypothetical protein
MTKSTPNQEACNARATPRATSVQRPADAGVTACNERVTSPHTPLEAWRPFIGAPASEEVQEKDQVDAYN